VTDLFFDPLHPVLWSGIAFLGFLQITALLLNLLPIPGLDGYNALEPHLSPETQRALAQFKPYGFLLLFLLLLAPPLNYWFFQLVDSFFELSGVPGLLWRAGAGLMQFWRQ
jgi:Zn-dependent protease